MACYRLVTTGTPYKVPGSEVEHHASPDNPHAVAALHVELAKQTGHKVTDTVIQYRDRWGGWNNHGGAR